METYQYDKPLTVNQGSVWFKIQADHRQREARLALAVKIAQKVDPALPEGWYSRFVESWDGGLGGMMFTHGSGSPRDHAREEFLLVSRIVESALGSPLKYVPWVEGEHVFCVHADGRIAGRAAGRDFTMEIQVRLFDTRECRVTYTEETVRKAVLDDACLGGAKDTLASAGENQ